jgi:hypothetical protein
MDETGCGLPKVKHDAAASVARSASGSNTSSIAGASGGVNPWNLATTSTDTNPWSLALASGYANASGAHVTRTLAYQAAPEPSSSPAAAATGTPDASGAATPAPTASASATPAPTPTPTPTPSLIPIPAAPQFPGSLIPPSPMPTGPPQATPPPLPTPTPSPSQGPIYLDRSGTPPPIPLKGASPTPTPPATASPAVSPSPLRTLAPNSVVAVADSLVGSTEEGQPGDLVGNVHIFYQEGQIVGQRAHFDGDHTVTITGQPYLINHIEDTVLFGDSIEFDTRTRRAVLINGRGETTEAVQTGKLHYTAQRLNAATSGVSHGERASFTTCENPHGGYHIEARQLDIYPGDKLIARKAVLFLGPLAVLYLPLLVIPLRNVKDPRRNSNFIPLIGYDSVEGYYIKARLDFYASETYYGYYRVDYFTKEGLGLGYTAFIGTKNRRRAITIDSYTINNHIEGDRQTNFSIQETENFSTQIRGQFGYTYTGDFGPNLTLPASQNLTASIVRQGDRSTQNVTVSRFEQGSISDNTNLGFIDSMSIGQYINQQLNLTYTQFQSPLSVTDTLHINTLTHVFTKLADYNLTYDKTNYTEDPFGYNSVPQLQILPHYNIPGLPWQPQLQLTAGLYTEPQNAFTAGRAELYYSQPVFLKVFGNSDFSGNYSIRQDWYTTGDEKAFAMQNAALSTPLGSFLVNSLTYNEQNPIGPADVPFQLLDHLSGGAHGAQDSLRFFDRDLWTFSVSTGTNFNRQAQPISYQFTARPSLLAYLSIGGYWTPGPGQGFGTTNVQIITPFGYDTSVQFSTNVDWKNKGRLEDKNVYLNKIIGKCYSLQLAYNEDLKQFYFTVVILAFPSNGLGGGLGIGGGTNTQSSSILPQSFAF